MIIKPDHWIHSPDENGNGLLHADAGDFPLPIETHNVPEDAVTLGQDQEFTIILDAAEPIDLYADKTAYDESLESPMAAESCIPCGLFPPHPDPDFTPAGVVYLNGIVTEVAESAAQFGFDEDDALFKITCLGKEYTVIVYSDMLAGETVEVGNVISGTFFVQGWPEGV